jgi:hypothetical protein
VCTAAAEAFARFQGHRRNLGRSWDDHIALDMVLHMCSDEVGSGLQWQWLAYRGGLYDITRSARRSVHRAIGWSRERDRWLIFRRS